jgi:hypothetical protein
MHVPSTPLQSQYVHLHIYMEQESVFNLGHPWVFNEPASRGHWCPVTISCTNLHFCEDPGLHIYLDWFLHYTLLVAEEE